MISTWLIPSIAPFAKGEATVVATTVLGTDVLLVVSVSLGAIRIGQVLPTSLGLPANTTVIAFLTGIGGTGTYQLSAVAGIGAGTGSISLHL